MNLGNTIKSVRQKQGIKQNELAEYCKISPAYLSQIENNVKEPTLATINVISNCLGLPAPILFFLSLEISDVKSEKKEALEFLLPSIKSMINEFFINHQD